MMPCPDLPKASIIIATYNRPKELAVAIGSILDQTVKPLEIIVVDDGALPDPPLRSEALRKGIRYTYIRKSPDNRGLTRSRNIGIEAAAGDILFFLDDDIQLFTDFLETSLTCYHNHPHIDGMGGGERLNKKPSISQKLWFCYEILFCMTGFKKGYFLPSAFSTNLGNPNLKTRFGPVEFLGGASFSFRRHVFETARFSEEFAGYGLGEDKEFSYRISNTHSLYANPDAKLYHFESPAMRYQKHDKAKAKILSKYHFLTRVNVKNRFKGFWFCYAMTGFLLKRMIIMLISFDRSEVDRVMGTLAGFALILKKNRHPMGCKQKNSRILLSVLAVCLTWLFIPPCPADTPMFPIPPQLDISSTRHTEKPKSTDIQSLTQGIQPSMQTVPDGVWRTVDPGGSGGTLDFVMHPADGTLLASSDMGRSLLRCNDWHKGFEPIAPPGHPTLDVLVPHPRQKGIWYAGFDSPDGKGLFRSTDNGDTWDLIHSSSSMARNTIYGLAIETRSSDTLIWGIKNQGLIISRDNGQTFADFSKGLDIKHLYGFSQNLSARNPLLTAETGNQTLLFLATQNGLYQRSLHPDAADLAWKKILNLPAEPVICLAHDRVKKWVWAATRSGRLFRGDIVTGRWEQMPYSASSPAPPDITLLQTHPKKPGHLWCFSHGRGGLFHTQDLGKTWQWLSKPLLTDTKTYQGNVPKDYRHRHKFTRDYFFIHPDNPDHLILGDMYQSMDGGNTWQFFATRYLPDRHAWQGKGLTLLTAYRAFWDQTNPNRVYLGFSDTGLMRTDDRGFSVTSLWSSQYPDLYPLAYWSTQMLDTSGSCMAFAADPEFATTQFYGMSGKGGKNSANGMLFTTATDGRHWEPVFPEQSGLPGGMITDLIIMDGNGYGRRTLYAVTNTLDRDRPVSGIYFSKDSGRTFERLADNLTSPLGFPLMNLDACRDHPDVLYAAAGSEGGKRPARQLQKSLDTPLPDGGVFRSDDAGYTWIRTGGLELAGAVQVAIHPHDPDIAYAAVVPGRGKSDAEAHVKRGGILKTLDGGRTWNHVLDFSSPVPGLGVIDAGAPTSVAINPVLPDIIYAAVDRAGVFRTMDSGTTWHRVDWDGLKRFQATYHTLTINPHDPAEFYLALFGNAFLAYRDPDAAKALARSAGHLPLVPNGDFEQIRNNGTPVHWTWNNLAHPGPDGSPILTIAPAPDRKGSALQVNMSAATYQNSAFTGDNQGPITFLSTRMPPWAMSQVRGNTIRISYDIHATRLKGPDLPILSLVETVGLNRKMIAELPAVLAYTRTPYEKTDIKKGHPLAGKWMTVTTTASVSPRANALTLVLHTTAENKKTMLYIDNITITIAGKTHGR